MYEHPVFGTIRDIKSLSIFSETPIYSNKNNNNNNNNDNNTTSIKKPNKQDILVLVSDSGHLSFIGWSADMQRLICISQVHIF